MVRTILKVSSLNNETFDNTMNGRTLVVQWFEGGLPFTFLSCKLKQGGFSVPAAATCIVNSFYPYLPVQRHLKFSHVFGQTSVNSSNTILPASGRKKKKEENRQIKSEYHYERGKYLS